jgi:hypothetical protein
VVQPDVEQLKPKGRKELQLQQKVEEIPGQLRGERKKNDGRLVQDGRHSSNSGQVVQSGLVSGTIQKLRKT